MTNEIKTGVCVIGAGSSGLSVAAGTAQLGLDTILIERGDMGGDCLNTGCVPSKALLAAAKRAQLHRSAGIQGITPTEPEVEHAGIQQHVLDTIAAIEPNDSQQRFEDLGVRVIRATAELLDGHRIRAGDDIIHASYIVLATGSKPLIPSIPGLEADKVLTNESIFNLDQRPEHLLVIGGGPIGIEMAQAHRRLGSKVSVFDMDKILPRDDTDNVAILRNVLLDEGIQLLEQADIKQVRHGLNGVTIEFEQQGNARQVSGSQLLVATGRSPVLDGLGLDRPGIQYNNKGISVDRRLRTNIRHIYAIGDVAGGPQFTHVAGYHAGVIIRNICFKMPAKTDYTALPWVTYTEPELAQVGLTANAARQQFGATIKTVEWSFAENDRAIAERTTQGRIRIVATRRGRVLGVSIVGAHAGELISLWGLVISAGLKLGSVAGMIMPYPTLSEVSKRAAGAWYTPGLFSNKTRWLVRLLQYLPF